MAIFSLNQSISCEFEWDPDTYGYFSFGKLLNSLVSFNDEKDLFAQEAQATPTSHDTSLMDDINGNKGISGYFNLLSRDEILSVSVYLNPTELRKLSITCSGLWNSINNSMWKQYNVIRNYRAWDLSILSRRISYACFYYKIGRFDMAAKLGHPEAIHQIRKRQRENTNIISSYDRYLDYKDHHYYGFVCYY